MSPTTSVEARAIRVALPRGDLRTPVAERLRAANFIVEGYGEGSRSYRFDVEGIPGVQVRVFSDQDIPIQVALGHYDFGIASRMWIDELLVRFPNDSVVPLRRLDIEGGLAVQERAWAQSSKNEVRVSDRRFTTIAKAGRPRDCASALRTHGKHAHGINASDAATSGAHLEDVESRNAKGESLLVRRHEVFRRE